MPKKHYKTGEKQWKKNLDQFLTLNLDQFLTLKPPNLGPVISLGTSDMFGQYVGGYKLV